MPQISVVIPLFNAARYIGDTIQSVLNQTFDDFEVVIADDGSTDSSLDIVQGFRDKRIRTLTHSLNTGFSSTINRGIIASTGSYIALLASDDLLTRDSLAVRFSHAAGYNLICGQAAIIGPYTTLMEAYSTPFNGPPRQFYGPTNLVSRKAFEQFGLFDEHLQYGTDREMWVRLFGWEKERRDRGLFLCLPDLVGYYRIRPDSVQQLGLHRPTPVRLIHKAAVADACERRREVIVDVRRLDGSIK